eukprot:2931657-Rhodomonas_salina.2
MEVLHAHAQTVTWKAAPTCDERAVLEALVGGSVLDEEHRKVGEGRGKEGKRRDHTWEQNARSRCVSVTPGKPTFDLNHCLSPSTSDTRACIGSNASVRMLQSLT